MSINFNSLDEITKAQAEYPHVELLIVTKTRTIETIKKLIQLGYKNFGENRVQETTHKFTQDIIIENNLTLHLIGPLQTNKVKDALKTFHVIQSVDRIKLVDAISKELNKDENIMTKDFFIQINIGKEEQKSGVDIINIESFYEYCLKSRLNIIGLMCIPPDVYDPSEYFDQMQRIKNKLEKKLKLSMGMSNDYQIAMRYGSDLIRVGSKIFD